jgi:hypothetical protein
MTSRLSSAQVRVPSSYNQGDIIHLSQVYKNHLRRPQNASKYLHSISETLALLLNAHQSSQIAFWPSSCCLARTGFSSRGHLKSFIATDVRPFPVSNVNYQRRANSAIIASRPAQRCKTLKIRFYMLRATFSPGIRTWERVHKAQDRPRTYRRLLDHGSRYAHT